jgi:hypothetical protein
MAAPRRRKALPITEAELRLIASAAISGLHGTVLDANHPAKWVSFECKTTPFGSGRSQLVQTCAGRVRPVDRALTVKALNGIICQYI